MHFEVSAASQHPHYCIRLVRMRIFFTNMQHFPHLAFLASPLHSLQFPISHRHSFSFLWNPRIQLNIYKFKYSNFLILVSGWLKSLERWVVVEGRDSNLTGICRHMKFLLTTSTTSHQLLNSKPLACFTL